MYQNAQNQKTTQHVSRRSRRRLFGLAASLSAATLLGISAPAGAETAKASPKEVVTAFYDLAFAKGEVVEAANKYISPTTYIQHNPGVADGRDAFVAALGGMLKNSGMRAEVKRVIADGNLVVVHARWAVPGNSEVSPLAVMDIFRVQHGHIVEHWDAMQEVPTSSANSNTMF